MGSLYRGQTVNLDDPIINRDVVAKINDPSSLLTLPTDEFESQKKVACTIIMNIFVYMIRR